MNCNRKNVNTSLTNGKISVTRGSLPIQGLINVAYLNQNGVLLTITQSHRHTVLAVDDVPSIINNSGVDILTVFARTGSGGETYVVSQTLANGGYREFPERRGTVLVFIT